MTAVVFRLCGNIAAVNIYLSVCAHHAAADTGAAAERSRVDGTAVYGDRTVGAVFVIAVSDAGAGVAFRCDRTAVNTDTLAVVAARRGFVAAADTRACAERADADVAAVNRNDIR